MEDNEQCEKVNKPHNSLKLIGAFCLLGLGLYLAAVIRIYVFHDKVIFNIFKYPDVRSYLIISIILAAVIFFFQNLKRSKT